MASALHQNWHLVRIFTLRDALGRYRGSLLGLGWSFLNPLLMLAVYTVAFSKIFKSPVWGPKGDTPAVLAIFCGMVTFGIFGEVLARAPTLILSNPNYVKKVVFPLEILPVTVLGSALLHALIGLGILLVGQLLIGSGLHFTILWLPVVLLPLVLIALGIGWTFAALGVFVRDLGQSVGVIAQVFFFLSPVVYPASQTAESPTTQALLWVNPMTTVIESARATILFGLPPHWLPLALVTAFGAAFAWFGYVWFQKVREGFADVV